MTSSQTDITTDVVGSRFEHSTNTLQSSNTNLKSDEILLTKFKKTPPKIRWTQSETRISFKIYLVDIHDFEVDIDQNCLEFSAKVSKHSEYQFSLDLYSDLTQHHRFCKLKRYSLLEVEKSSDRTYWPRLTAQPTKYSWLEEQTDDNNSDPNDTCTDDDLLDGEQRLEELGRQLKEANLSQGSKHQEDSTATKQKNKLRKKPTNLDNCEHRLRHKDTNNIDIFNPFNKPPDKRYRNMKYDYRRETSAVDNSKNSSRSALDMKKTYLFCYNLAMFVVFLMAHLVLLIKIVSGTIDDDSVKGVANIIKWLTITQLLESVHPMLGLVPGGPFMPFLQVIGRLVVNHFLTTPEIRIGAAPYAHYLFVVWSCIEIFRYSFYALRVFKVDIYPLTWCRYSLFAPLYPMGGFCESMVILSTIRHIEKTGAYSISLPNAANISFHMPTFLKIYIFLLLGPSIFYLMKYMCAQRRKQLKDKVA